MHRPISIGNLELIEKYRSDDIDAILHLIDQKLEPTVRTELFEDFARWLYYLIRALLTPNHPEVRLRAEEDATLKENKRAHRYLRHLKSRLCRPETRFCDRMQGIDGLSYEEKVVWVTDCIRDYNPSDRVVPLLVATYIVVYGPRRFCGCGEAEGKSTSAR